MIYKLVSWTWYRCVKLWLSITTLFCQQGLSWEPKVFFSRGTGPDLLPHLVVTSPSRNRSNSLIGLSVKKKDPIPEPSVFVLYQGTSQPMLCYFWIALSSSGVIIGDNLIVFSPQGGTRVSIHETQGIQQPLADSHFGHYF